MDAAFHPASAFFRTLAAFMPASARASSTSSPLRLARHQTVALAKGQRLVQVVDGCVWITRDGCPDDVVLEAGGRFVHEPGARVLVHALEDARLVLAGAAGSAQNG